MLFFEHDGVRRCLCPPGRSSQLQGAVRYLPRENIEEENLPKAFSENAAEIAHVHVSNNDRGVPGRGHIDFRTIFRAIKLSGYDGWLTIEAFGRALPELVEPTRVWRDFFPSTNEVYSDGFKLIRDGWRQA